MMRLFSRILGAFLLSLILPSTVLADGIVFTINHSDTGTGERLGSTEIVVEGTLLKMTYLGTDDEQNHSTSSDIDMVYRSERREMVVVDHESKEYFVMDEAFLTTIQKNFPGVAGQPGGANPMMQQAYESALASLDAQNLSPQERAMAEKALRDTLGISGAAAPQPPSGPRSELINANLHDDINGFPADKYELHVNGLKTRELWVANWNDLGPGAQARETIDSWLSFFAAMRDQGGGPGTGPGGEANLFDVMDRIDGFPVAGSSLEDGKDFSLESVTERDLDPDAFEPPSGYRLRTMGGF